MLLKTVINLQQLLFWMNNHSFFLFTEDRKDLEILEVLKF